ncbi:gem-associated protein 7-like [Aphomia sociella]
MPLEADISEQTIIEKQNARAKLREGFLKALNELKGEPCSILTYEQSTVHATFSVWKPDGSDVLVKNVKTPASIEMSSALIRTPDILAIQFERPINLP